MDKLTKVQQSKIAGSLISRTVNKGTVIHSGSADCTGLLLIQKGQPDYEVFGNVIRELDKFSQQRGNGYQLAVKGQLFLFLYYAYGRGILFTEKKPGHAREKSRDTGVIREHLGRDYDQAAAELCFYSESHFMKYFKQYAGMPFIQYLNDYRLTRAGEYLKMTEENVTRSH